MSVKNVAKMWFYSVLPTLCFNTRRSVTVCHKIKLTEIQLLQLLIQKQGISLSDIIPMDISTRYGLMMIANDGCRSFEVVHSLDP